ncbi:MAG TPA: STM3941 family protein [Bacteroidia bacterium]|nr:STM3941 family protein [Bacteroidia bacterium]
MAQAGQIIIKRKKWMTLFVFILSCYLTYNFCQNIAMHFREIKSISFALILRLLLNVAFATASLALCIHALRSMLNKGPGLIVSNLGLLDNSGMVSAGMVFWTDVIEINKSRIFFSECILVKVKNPDRYIRNEKNVFKRFWLRTEYRRTGSPVNISSSGLAYKYNDLFRIIQDRYLASHVESRTYELKREKDTILREKRELIASINYAKRIQTAMLPSFTSIQQRIGENFILYIPKNIVSGDFYWIESEGDWVFFATCDCTGHGVPGALINIVCNNALNRAVREFGIVEPGKILDKVSQLIATSMGQDGEVTDGMDACLCSFNRKTRELFWAGANIPLWLVRKDLDYELLEFKPDKRSVGFSENLAHFTTHKIEIRKDDILYLTSDGYADQFGGETGKKLTRKRFKELLLLQKGKSLSEQKENLLHFHNEYKRQGDQIDDILVMGIRIEQ